MLPPLGAGSYKLQIWGKNTPIEVREFELVVGQQTNLEIDFNLQPGVVRYVQMESPVRTLNGLLTLTTFDGSGRELVSWRIGRNGNRSSPLSFVFRPEAVRLVVISEDGKRGEARLESEDIRLVLR